MVTKKTETADVKTKMETPEKEDVKIVNHPETIVAFKNDSIIVFQAKQKLEEHNYEFLSQWVRKENEATGLNIVLAPFSVNVKVGGE